MIWVKWGGVTRGGEWNEEVLQTITALFNMHNKYIYTCTGRETTLLKQANASSSSSRLTREFAVDGLVQSYCFLLNLQLDEIMQKHICYTCQNKILHCCISFPSRALKSENLKMLTKCFLWLITAEARRWHSLGLVSTQPWRLTES